MREWWQVVVATSILPREPSEPIVTTGLCLPHLDLGLPHRLFRAPRLVFVFVCVSSCRRTIGVMLGTHDVDATDTRCVREVVSEVVSEVVCALTSMPCSPERRLTRCLRPNFLRGLRPSTPHRDWLRSNIIGGRARENEARNRGHHSAVADSTR